MHRLVRFFALLSVAAPVAAHDFWLQPREWRIAPGVAVPFSVEVGHAAAREKWAGGADRVIALRDVSAGGAVDLRPLFREGGNQPHLIAAFRRPGLHIVTMTTNNTPSDLPAIRFNDFIKAEGLTPAIEARRRAGTTNKPGRERFSRRAKALVQIGPFRAQDNRVAVRPLGLSLEIVPLRNPYALGANRKLPVQIIFGGKPLAGALVKLTNLDFDAKPVAVAVTDRRGQAVFRIPATGSWLVNTIWTRPVVSSTEEFETTFSSLTFGYPNANKR